MPEKKKKRDEINKHLFKLILINVFLIASAFLWLDYLGLINLKRDILPVVAKVPGMKFILPSRSDDPFLLKQEEERKLEYLKQMEWGKLKKKEEQLEEMKMKLDEKEKGLAEQLARLQEKEKEIDSRYIEKVSRDKLVEQQAVYLVSMQPKDAVSRLSNMDDLLIIDIFRAIEKKAGDEGTQSIVPYFLSLMDSQRASVIQRKMTVVEEDIINKTNL